MDWHDYLSLAALVSFVVTGIGVWRGMFSQASKQQNTEVITSAETLTSFWKEQAEGYKVMMAEKDTAWNSKFEVLTRELGVLQGQLAATESQRAQFEAILKDRNPETQKFQAEVIKSLGEISIFMGSLNQHMEQQNHGFKVESVITPDGKK